MTTHQAKELRLADWPYPLLANFPEMGFLSAVELRPMSLPSNLRSSQDLSRPPGRLFVISHHALRLLRLIRRQIVGPPKPDRLKPKLRLHLERSYCIPGRDYIP